MYGLESVGQVFVVGVVLFLAILALLMPLFVWQIRDSTRAINKKLTRIVDQLESQ